MSARPSLLPAAAVALLAACAPQGNFPSLAPRAVERQYGGGPPPTGPCAAEADGCYEAAKAEPAPVADDSALRTRITALTAAARQGQGEFAERLPAASAAAAKAGATGSDAWIGAQQQLSRLEAARARTLEALEGLDALVLDRARQATSEADVKALTEAAAEVRQIADGQQAEIERLRSGLSQP